MTEFDPTPAALWSALLSHLAACGLLAVFAYPLLPSAYRQPRLATLFYLFSSAFFIPGLGLLGLMAAVLMARFWPSFRDKFGYREVPLPQFLLETAQIGMNYGIGGIRARLTDHRAPAESRIKALLAVQSMPTRLASPVLREMLDDPIEDIRLLAYGLLDNREKRLNEDIHQERLALEAAADELSRAHHAKRLAHLYWELVYQNLVQGDLRAHARAQAMSYVNEALAITSDDAALWVLLGKLINDTGHIEAAYQAFEKALELGYPENRLLPYQAEIAFKRRDLERVRELIARLAKVEPDDRIDDLVAYWTGAKRGLVDSLMGQTAPRAPAGNGGARAA